MEKKTFSILSNKAFYIPIILLSIYFIIRLIDTSKIMWIFPFDFTNDISSHMAKVYFLAQYGFHQLVPYWYNGYVLFKFYPPAWFYFTLPVYYLTKNIQVATFISILLIYALGFIAISIFGKNENISFVKSIAFFLLFFANPLAIGQLLRVGRVTELFAWLMLIPFAIIIFHYKNRKIDSKFFLIIIFYGIMLLSHQVVFIISSFLLLSLILAKIKQKRELFKIASNIALTAILTSFWWFPFIRDISQSSIMNTKYNFGHRLLEFNKELLVENTISLIIPIAFLILFYFYWTGKNKSKKELLFFLPEITIAVLFLLRIVAFIPVLSFIYPDVYNMFLLFFSIYFLLKTEFNKSIKKYISISLILVIILGITISIVYTPWFAKNTELDKDTISIFPYVEGRFIMVGYEESYGKAFYSYAPIYYNLETASGWSQQEVNSEYLNLLRTTRLEFDNKNCEGFINAIKEINITYVISQGNYCNFLKNCNLNEKIIKGEVCLYLV